MRRVPNRLQSFPRVGTYCLQLRHFTLFRRASRMAYTSGRPPASRRELLFPNYGRLYTHTHTGRWDMIVGFPPCTFISNAGACRLYHKGELVTERYIKGLQGAVFLLTVLSADCPKVAVENPVSSSVFNIPQHSQEIQPYMFGHPFTKKTRLWLRGLPPLMPTNVVTPTSPYCPSGTSRKFEETNLSLFDSTDELKTEKSRGAAKRGNDRLERSKFWEGIANAMASQWGGNANV